ncbi:serine/threonine protein kinase [Butyrivibrio fibrisolvens DSM 3071]|uniref:non-specific serine/threonine protein kinase n=1 Tax=Butyrivibrio fibrisolvens DSM 3071 TaxID=1121131 RepID=A0A1M6EYB3_BUTFI|nr:Stk1 family PASTA domain-containing Ser/Thr kinase [Butyrivibrio fibrisolvens]SHI90369.1 serine/threonine protein kinase [Butyrivibrio fibrisolvens DSM 3071]
MIRIGMIIGDRYEIQEKIGTGGMSDVYRALDHKLNRPVAVKVLKQEFSENQNFVQKFRSEAQAAAGLMHPNIVNVYDVGNDKGVYYFVMELVDGITLKKYIEKKSRLTVKEAVSIGIQVAMGLDAAHKNNIVHRDIKPQNIMISKDGKVKVTDFGIAKAASSNTITSNVMGSVHYTSPEQARGGFSDAKSDIYSLGVTLFEMVTGRVPFNGDTTVAIAIKHIQEQFPSPATYAPDLPVSVEKIILKCCQKSPDRRYQNATELIKDLKRSLITPDEDFVVLVDPDEEGATRIASDEEQNMIRGGNAQGGKTGEMRLNDTGVIDPPEQDKRPRNSYNNRDAQNGPAPQRPQNDKNYRDEYDEGDYVYDRSYRSGNKRRKDVRPDDNLDKIMIIMAVIAVALVFIILIFIVGGHLGLFGGSDSDNPSAVSSQEMSGSDASGIIVPDVVGMSYIEAKTTLQEKGFKVEKVDDNTSAEAKNVVVAQSPDKDTRQASGSTITITVSTGAHMSASDASTTGESTKEVEMPNLIGMDEASARLTLVELGFSNSNVNVVTVNNNDTSLIDKVINQNPAKGTKVSTDAVINLEVSVGPAATAAYVFVGNIDAPTENSYYTSGVTVNITITAADGTLLYSSATSSFPVSVVQNQNQAYTKSSTATLEMSFVVNTESGAVTQSVTRTVSLTQMQ